MEELKPCPFCGGIGKLQSSGYGDRAVYCTSCRAATMRWYRDKPRATTAWNTRPDSWISVEDRLPEGAKGVLVWEPICKNIYTMYWEDNEWRFFGGRGKTYYNITHWQPLPQPPKGSE